MTSTLSSNQLWADQNNKYPLSAPSVVTGDILCDTITFLNDTVGYLAAPLDYYEENTSVNLNFTGSATTTQVAHFTRLGSLVTMRIPKFAVLTTAASKFTSGATDIPARFRPIATFQFYPVGQDNSLPGSENMATCRVTSGGQVIISEMQLVTGAYTSANFANAVNCGLFEDAVITYSVV